MRRPVRVALDDDPLSLLRAKGWGAVGAFDPAERSHVLDSLGFAAQLVFPTFAATQFAGNDVDMLYAGSDALNRAMAAFCADDRRMLAVASVPWGVPERTIECARRAIDEGCAAVMVPTDLPRGVRVADASRPSPVVGAARGLERPGGEPHRRRRNPGPAWVPRQRPHRHRLPRRWRERPRQGFHGHPPATRDLLGGDGARRHVPDVPRPPRCLGRGRRDVGRAVDSSTRPGDAVRQDRAAAACARQAARASSSTTTCGSRRSPASPSVG